MQSKKGAYHNRPPGHFLAVFMNNMVWDMLTELLEVVYRLH